MATARTSLYRHLLFALLVTATSVFSAVGQVAAKNPLPDYVIKKFGKPPAVPKGALSKELQAAVKAAFIDSTTQSTWGREQTAALSEISKSKDPRIVWLISDMMRFVGQPTVQAGLANIASSLLGIKPPSRNHWGVVTDHLIAWNIPAPPDYLTAK
ncbi:MAG: hypothetical protein AAF709_20085, partial [Pseudomonadota bacterium]